MTRRGGPHAFGFGVAVRLVAVLGLLSPAAATGATDAMEDTTPLAWAHDRFMPMALRPGVATTDQAIVTQVVHPSREGFTEALLSCNLGLGPEDSAALETRVVQADGDWTPWLRVATWDPPGAERRSEEVSDRPVLRATTGDARVRVDIDYLRSDAPLHALQARVVALAGTVRVVRIDATLSSPTRAPLTVDPPRLGERVELTLPFRDQKTAGEHLAGRLCSPASVAMVVARDRVSVDTGVVAPLAHDPAHDIYGNWARNCQAAHALGQTAVLTRLHGWAEAESWIRGEKTGFGVPVIISFSAPRGSIPGADYNTASGHLIVVHGFDEKGDPIVTDPAFGTEAEARRTYPRDALGRAWLRNGNGTVYLIYPEPQSTDQSAAD